VANSVLDLGAMLCLQNMGGVLKPQDQKMKDLVVNCLLQFRATYICKHNIIFDWSTLCLYWVILVVVAFIFFYCSFI